MRADRSRRRRDLLGRDIGISSSVGKFFMACAELWFHFSCVASLLLNYYLIHRHVFALTA
jgi:hypothetical protein